MAKASGKHSYEEQWRQAFEKAEMPPSPNVWKHIDQQLTAQEGGKYKRGFFFYRAVAAVLLLCIAGLGWYIVGQQHETGNIAQQDSRNETSTAESLRDARDTTPEAAIAQRQQPSGQSTTEAPESAETSPAASDEESRSTASNPSANRPLATVEAPRSSESAIDAASQGSSSARVAADDPTSKTLIFPSEAVSTGEEVLHPANHRVGRLAALSPDALALAPPTWADSIEQLYYVPQYREKTAPGHEERSVQFFAGLSMAPSFFDPNFQSPGRANTLVAEADVPSQYSLDRASETFSNTSIATNNRSTVVREGLENRSTLSFSYGFDIGLALGEHWSIESGLDYQNFQTSTETHFTVVDLQTGERYPLVASNALSNRATYANTTPIGTAEEVANQFQFVSVPLQLAYNLRFSKVMLSVSPGVAANFFLGNRISSDRYASATIDNDGSSPFNSQYLSALISGGVFYQILENYSVSFTPSYQFAVSELTKTTATFSSLPQSFGLKLGFRYNFR